MSNLLRNPNLTGFSKPPRTFTDKSGNIGYMENPDDWEYTFFSLHDDDPNRVPQSLHRDKGYCIAAGWRRWEAGYVQRGVPLQSGKRYVVKAAFQPDVSFPNSPVDLTAVQWRFWIEGSGDKAYTDWTATSKGQYKQPEEHLFVIEARRDMTVDIYFKARSIWENNVCDFNLHAITLEEVPADYGTPVYIGGQPAAASPVPAHESLVPDGPPLYQMDREAAWQEPAAPAHSSFLDLMTFEDAAVIITGFRAAASNGQFDPAISAAFARFADVLERYQEAIGVG